MIWYLKYFGSYFKYPRPSNKIPHVLDKNSSTCTSKVKQITEFARADDGICTCDVQVVKIARVQKFNLKTHTTTCTINRQSCVQDVRSLFTGKC